MATICDLNTIKTNIKSLLDTANTTTASPVDLSNNMSKRVQKVLNVHPSGIPIQASFYPFVTCYIDSKPIESDDISKNQLNSKRRSKLNIDVVGGVFNQNVTDVTKDPADQDINILMENVELILRSDPDLQQSVLYQRPTSCQYYSNMLGSTAHIRIGIIRLEALVFY